MIINKRTNFIIETPEKVLKMPKHLYDNLDISEYKFVVPEHIKDNSQKIIYKIGFLKKFYLALYPTMAISEIYKKINIEWQVFVGVRQMERHWKKYIELFD